jgi:tRNA(Ile)-lysidine synthase
MSEDGTDRKKLGFAPIALHAGDDFFIPEAGLRVMCSHVEHDNVQAETAKIKTFCTFLFHIEEICGTISVGSRREGDKIRLFGSNHTKSLKKLFIDNRVPAAKRDLIPVVFDEQGVLAVHSLCRSNRALPKPSSNILKIEFIKDDKAYERRL